MLLYNSVSIWQDIRNNRFALGFHDMSYCSFKVEHKRVTVDPVSKLKLDHPERCFTDSAQLQLKKNIYFQSTTDIKFDCFIISFDHFLQPKDINTQHKSKISHVIFIHHKFFSVPTLIPRGHGTVIQFSMSDSLGSSGHPAQGQMWLNSKCKISEKGMYRCTSKTTDTFTDYKGILMEKAIVQACDTVSTWSNGYTQTNDAQFPLTTSSTQKICFSMKINGESTAYFQIDKGLCMYRKI